MKLTVDRVSRYLVKVKQFTDYVLKVKTKDREALLMLGEIRFKMLEVEKKMRDLMEHMVKER